MRKTVIVVVITFLFTGVAAAGLPVVNLLDGVTPDEDGHIDVLTVFAHQDDETIYGGGAIFEMLKDKRVRLHILCLTLGDLSEAKDRLGISGDHLGRIRSEELETAAAVYDAVEVIQFRYHDGHLKEADRAVLVDEIADVMDRVGAEIVFTHDPFGITGHDDHIACSSAATEAFMRSDARKLYYPTLPRWAYKVMSATRSSKGKPEPLLPTVRVRISNVKRMKKMAFYAHASQKHFSDVGRTAGIMMTFDYEYFAVAVKPR